MRYIDVTKSQAVARIADRASSQQTIYKLAIRPVTKLHLQLLSRYCALSVLGFGVVTSLTFRGNVKSSIM